MHRYSIKVNGKTVKFRAESQQEARYKAFSINPYYRDLKRLESRWWLLIYPVLFLLGIYGVKML